MTEETTVTLSDRDLQEAERLGVTADAMAGAKAVQIARMAESVHMSVPEYVRWTAVVDEAITKRGAVSIDDWERSRAARPDTE
jgi:hypothetical protein